MGILKSTTDLTTITLKKYISEKPKKNRRAETKEKMKLAIVCVFALVLAINVEGAYYCFDGCKTERGLLLGKCRKVKCSSPNYPCVTREEGPMEKIALGCYELNGGKLPVGNICYGHYGYGRGCYCPGTLCNHPKEGRNIGLKRH